MSYSMEKIIASDGKSLAFHSWIPESPWNICIQLSHGMMEFATRYEEFALEANKNKIAVFAIDHRGHGQTAQSLSDLGHISDSKGYLRVCEDQREISSYIENKHPQKKIVFFGHSFGSFIAQRLLETEKNRYLGIIISGTSGPQYIKVFFGRILSHILAFGKNGRKKSELLDFLTFGSYTNHLKDVNTKNDWLTTDVAEVEQFNDSPWLGFLCSAAFFRDMFDLITLIHKKKELKKITKNVPILLFSGTDDPVGACGKTVISLSQIYEKQGNKNVRCTLYPHERHELLNSPLRQEVMKNIFLWINEISI